MTPWLLTHIGFTVLIPFWTFASLGFVLWVLGAWIKGGRRGRG